MRALVQTKNGPPEVLQVQQRPEPTAGRGKVRIKVHACGLNFADVQARVGLYPDAPKPPSVLGYEVAGEIEGIGDGVEGFEVGQRVTCGTRFGGFAELAVADAADVVTLPDKYGYEEGAAIPVAYITAYFALVKGANLQHGERVLIHGAAGGVGIAATQIARHLGAEIFGTASKQKHDVIRRQGVDHPIDYRNEDVSSAIKRLTNDAGLDVVLDPLGGKSFKQSYKLLRAGGRLVPYGLQGMMSGEKRSVTTAAKVLAQMPRFNAIRLMSKSKSVIGVNLLSYWDDHGTLKHLIEPLQDLMDQDVIKPVIAEAFPLERAADAHRFIQERRNIGKVVLTL